MRRNTGLWPLLLIVALLAFGVHTRDASAQLPVALSNTVDAGALPHVFLSTAAVYTAEIKGSTGIVWDVDCWNTDTGDVMVRLYDQTGAPGTGDGANIKMRILVPASQDHVSVALPNGRRFTTGIGIRATKGIGNTDATALVADTAGCNIGFQ